MIQFKHVSKSYGKTPILKDLSFTIPDGQFVVLIGPSGCGKTTTLKTINRLIEPDSGVISIDGQDIRSTDKVTLRRHIGYVIQQIGLFPNMTVAQNICVVPRLLKYDKAQCAPLSPISSKWWAWSSMRTNIPRSSPAASSSASACSGPWRPRRPSC